MCTVFCYYNSRSDVNLKVIHKIWKFHIVWDRLNDLDIFNFKCTRTVNIFIVLNDAIVSFCKAFLCRFIFEHTDVKYKKPAINKNEWRHSIKRLFSIILSCIFEFLFYHLNSILNIKKRFHKKYHKCIFMC
jgi:hypothetical protein